MLELLDQPSLVVLLSLLTTRLDAHSLVGLGLPDTDISVFAPTEDVLAV